MAKRHNYMRHDDLSLRHTLAQDFYSILDFFLDRMKHVAYNIFCRQDKLVDVSGGIAQLGERLNGIQEVSGSIPLISTITIE